MESEVRIMYTKDALRSLKKLHKKIALRITSKIEENSMMENPLERAKALKGTLSGRYRYRVGTYRVIFSVDSQGRITILTVLMVKHRKDIYR